MSTREKNSERKRRADAWEIANQVSPENQRKVFNWARSFGYGRAIELCKTELKINPPSSTGMQSFYEYFCGIETADRVTRGIADAGAIREIAVAGGDVSEAMVAALENEAAAAILAGDMDRIKLLVSLALKAREGRFEERKYKDLMKTAIEKGLDALAEQAQGNEEALRYYNLFRDAVMKSMENVSGEAVQT